VTMTPVCPFARLLVCSFARSLVRSFARSLVRSHEDSRLASCPHVGCTLHAVLDPTSAHCVVHTPFSLQFTVSKSPITTKIQQPCEPGSRFRLTSPRPTSQSAAGCCFPLSINATSVPQRRGAVLLSRGRLAGRARLGLVSGSAEFLVCGPPPRQANGSCGQRDRETDKRRGARARETREFCSTEGVCLCRC
jgi:hypothetical protein